MVVDSFLVHYDILLNNPTDIITKCASLLLNQAKVITKYVRFLITKCDSFIKICDSYYTMRRFYYKMRRLLQNALVSKIKSKKSDKNRKARKNAF